MEEINNIFVHECRKIKDIKYFPFCERLLLHVIYQEIKIDHNDVLSVQN